MWCTSKTIPVTITVLGLLYLRESQYMLDKSRQIAGHDEEAKYKYEQESRHTALVVIPMRDDHQSTIRRDMLSVLLPILKARFRISSHAARYVVVEQAHGLPFNRGRLFNTGFDWGRKRWPETDFAVFHDVDEVPEGVQCEYNFPEKPQHLLYSRSKTNHRPSYAANFGGIVSFSHTDFYKINGFSNNFWGWGGEDDELFKRVRYVFKMPNGIANKTCRTRSLDHENSRRITSDYNNNNKLLSAWSPQYMNKDGLSSLTYNVHNVNETYDGYTNIRIQFERR